MFIPSFLQITNLYIFTSLHTHQYLFMRALYIYIFFLSDIFISFPLSYISRYTPLRSRAIRRLVPLDHQPQCPTVPHGAPPCPPSVVHAVAPSARPAFHSHRCSGRLCFVTRSHPARCVGTHCLRGLGLGETVKLTGNMKNL